MNREIKFRGKSSLCGTWLYGLLVRVGCMYYIAEENDFDTDGHHIKQIQDMPLDVERDTIGQFTGLTDKNGKSVYEGDIIMCIGQRKDNKGKKYLREVLFHNGSFCMTVPEYNMLSPLRDHIVDGKLWWEVIGNIYDNYNLLEE